MNSEATATTEAALPEQELHSTYQLGGVVLRVRDDIDVLVREHGGKPTYILEDELSSKYYRIGAAEYTFLTLLDGQTNFATALGRTAAIMKREALTEHRAAVFCKWLVQNGLASTEHSRSIARLEQHSQRGEVARRKGRLSVLSQRFALCHPRRSVDLLEKIFGWMFSGIAGGLWLLLVIAGCVTIWLHWERFRQTTAGVISRDNWIWLIFTWMALKLIHEAAHAVACRRFGGNVREFGVLFIVFIPLPYVDVSSAWRFASKRHRVLTSAAGMMAELAIAAIAAIVWSQAPPGLVSQHASNVIFSAGLTTLLFNANPLMRFDGYYMLTDLLELPNLYTHGQQAWLHLGRRWGLGLKAQPPSFPEGRQAIILGYGIAAVLWKILICVGLLLAADSLFYGLGSLLAFGAVTAWLVVPIFKLLKFVFLGSRTEQPSRARFAFLLGLLMTIGVALHQWVPWYSSTQANVVVDYYPQIEIRNAVSGFVQSVEVEPGDRVRVGQVLLRLRNEELAVDLRKLNVEIELAQQRVALFLDEKNIPSLQVEQNRLEALEKRQQELQDQVQGLTVVAPVDGYVLRGDISQLVGRYVSIGSLLTRLGSSDEAELLAMVAQPQAEFFRGRIGSEVPFHVVGTGPSWMTATLFQVSPRASRDFPHPALAAHAGGPLAVRASNSEDAEQNEHTEQYELLHPHFLARLKLKAACTRVDLAAGMTGKLAFVVSRGTIGSHMQREAWNWWLDRRNAAAKQLYRR